MTHLFFITAGVTAGLVFLWLERAVEAAQMAVGGEGG